MIDPFQDYQVLQQSDVSRAEEPANSSLETLSSPVCSVSPLYRLPLRSPYAPLSLEHSRSQHYLLEHITYSISVAGHPPVQRRYSDFVVLLALLKNAYPGLVLPVLPQKSMRAKIPISTINSAFLHSRREQLLIFLKKVSTHPETAHCPLLAKFLTTDLEMTQPRGLSPSSLVSTSQSLLSSYFSPPKQTPTCLHPHVLRLQSFQAALLSLSALLRNHQRSQQSSTQAHQGLADNFSQLQDLYPSDHTQQLSITYSSLGEQQLSCQKQSHNQVILVLEDLLNHIVEALSQSLSVDEPHLSLLEQDLRNNFLPMLQNTLKGVYQAVLQIDRQMACQAYSIWDAIS